MPSSMQTICTTQEVRVTSQRCEGIASLVIPENASINDSAVLLLEQFGETLQNVSLLERFHHPKHDVEVYIK